ncbi:MAG: GNAT family N-acetyltransferase [Telluria sp.]
MSFVLETTRLRLAPITDEHLDGLHAMNSDLDVMRYLSGKPETREETQALIKRVKARWAEWGFSWFSLFDKASGELIGAAGVQYLGMDPANPHEIGWRLRKDRWGQGLASEAARRLATFAFDDLDAPLLCSVCHPENTGSARVMERLGMRYIGEETWYGMTTSRYDITRGEWLGRADAQAR